MSCYILIFCTALTVTLTKGQTPLDTVTDCATPTVKDYQTSTYKFLVPAYQAVARHSKFNFVFSSHSIWIMLAAIAEGSHNRTQEELFEILNLPKDLCTRQKYYKMATTRIIPDKIRMLNTRAIVFDEAVTINKTWLNIVSNNSLLDVVTAPIRKDPILTENEIKRIMEADVPRLRLSGNSVLIDTHDYSGLWTTAFADAVIKRAPFYNQEGDQIGSVDLMRIKRKARMGFVRYLNVKVLELPIGPDNQYRMLFFKVLDRRSLASVIEGISGNIILEMFASLRDSNVPIDIAIPRTMITGEVDFRTVLEDLGVTSIWKDEQVTKYISTPSALPSSYVQRATAILNEKGVTDPAPESKTVPDLDSGLDPEIGTDFIANQPFLMGLFDFETLTPLLNIAFTQPTYPI